MEERRQIVRRKADRELREFIESKTGQKPESVLRGRKLRRAIRYSCKASIDMSVAHRAGASGAWDTDAQTVKARVLDLSEGGAALFCKYEIRPGARIGVRVQLYDGSNIEADSEVRWSKHKERKDGYALGVEFVEMDARNEKRLNHFLAELDATLGLE